jgi:hypothetical protein
MANTEKQIADINTELAELNPRSVVKKPKNNTNVHFFDYWSNPKKINDTGVGLVPDWGHKDRDKRLDQLAKQSNYFMTAVNNVVKKVFSVPPIVKLNDDERGQSEEDKDLLKFYQEMIKIYWYDNLESIIYNTLIFDNGWFVELLSNSGGGSKNVLKPSTLMDGTEIPVAGWEVKDTLRCTRTGDTKYPVRYLSTDNKEYKFHKSRILFGANLPSSDPAMYRYGFSSLSIVLHNVMQMKGFDDLIFNQVWDGDIGQLWFLWEKEGDGDRLQKVQNTVKQKRENYEKATGVLSVMIESDAEEAPKLERIDLQKLPENFDKREAVELLVTLIAFAIGVDVREVYHVKGGGATKADAETQDKKANKKFISWFLTTWENIINTHILPTWLIVNFDDIDEDDLRRKAEARKLLSETHKFEIETGVMTVEVAIEQLFEQKHITETQRDLLISALEERRKTEQEEANKPILGAVLPTPDRRQDNIQRQIKEAEPGRILATADGFVITDGDIEKAIEEAEGTKIGQLIS